MKLQPILHGNIRVVSTDYVIILRIKACLIRKRSLRLVIHIFYPGAGKIHKRIGKYVTGIVHSGRMCLQHSRAAVHIYYQSEQEITLPVHQAVSVVVLAYQPQGFTQLKRLGKTRRIKFSIYIHRLVTEHSHRDTAYLVMPHTQ